MRREALPQISVCLLTYNHAHIVAEGIQTILEQDFQSFEVILSDDGSTDATWDVVQAFARSDRRVRAIQTPRNLGMAGNANFAVAQSTAPYVALLHQDDLSDPSLLRRWFEVAERFPGVGFVSNGYMDAATSTAMVHSFPECNDGKQMLYGHLLSFLGCPFRGTALIRRSAWEAVGGMRERFGMLADVDLWMRLSARFQVGYVAEPLITVRQDRPVYYPDPYWRWNWPRMSLLYAIHATNHLENPTESPFHDHVRWAKFRLRISRDTIRWLAWATARRHWDILMTSPQVENEFELSVVKWFRSTLLASAGLARNIRHLVRGAR